jgi:hypothetical protein
MTEIERKIEEDILEIITHKKTAITSLRKQLIGENCTVIKNKYKGIPSGDDFRIMVEEMGFEVEEGRITYVTL